MLVQIVGAGRAADPSEAFEQIAALEVGPDGGRMMGRQKPYFGAKRSS
jgi:hypothetical protein